MNLVRPRLRTFAVLWLVVQAAHFAALAPLECCMRPPSTAASRPTCHEPAAAPHCTMTADHDGQCPMHAGRTTTNPRSASECAMRGTCDGPLAALLVLLSNQGILTRPPSSVPAIAIASVDQGRQERTLEHLTPPDAPPPRS